MKIVFMIENLSKLHQHFGSWINSLVNIEKNQNLSHNKIAILSINNFKKLVISVVQDIWLNVLNLCYAMVLKQVSFTLQYYYHLTPALLCCISWKQLVDFVHRQLGVDIVIQTKIGLSLFRTRSRRCFLMICKEINYRAKENKHLKKEFDGIFTNVIKAYLGWHTRAQNTAKTHCTIKIKMDIEMCLTVGVFINLITVNARLYGILWYLTWTILMVWYFWKWV